jgi:hypothetical protein
MLEDVGERFLDEPVEDRLEVARQPRRRQVGLYVDLEPGAFAARLRQPLEGVAACVSGSIPVWMNRSRPPRPSSITPRAA